MRVGLSISFFRKIMYFWKEYTPIPRACVQLTSQMERSAALFEFNFLPALSEIKGG